MEIMLPMKKTILLMLILASFALAQDNKSKDARPDFSGTWALDKAKSDLGPYERVVARGDITLVIEHKDPELKITRKFTAGGNTSSVVFAYYSDGRGETNPAALGNGDVKTKTRWDKKKLESKFSSSYKSPRDGRVTYFETIDRRELSADGKILTITTTRDSATTGMVLGGGTIKLVYNRVEPK
jgi:hypothetical protein